MEYFSSKRPQTKSPAPPATPPAESPILNEEDEAFLHSITSEGTPPELPERPGPPLPPRPQDLPQAGDTQGNDAQLVLFDDSQRGPLSDDPESIDTPTVTVDADHAEGAPRTNTVQDKKRSKWSFLRRDSRDSKRKATATGLMSAAEGLKSPDAQPNEDGNVSDPEARKEEEEMVQVLDDLDLAAVNNRVFSFSKESQELLRKCVHFEGLVADCGDADLI